MFHNLGWFIGLNYQVRSVKKLPDAKPRLAKVKPVAMLDTVQEIAIYIHRFHNLDLFQQGWYQIKLTMRWEDGEYTSVGTPARVVQYEAPDLGSGNSYGVWKIDDTDNSFSTQPFKIKYARQDILLSIMISFNFPLAKYEAPSTSAVILKFELMHAPILEAGPELQASLDASSAAVHEFRIPPKALAGLHSYCPVHFDVFHAVLVDVSVHICLLRSYTPEKRSSDPRKENLAARHFDARNQAEASRDEVTLIKALLTARDILLEEFQNLSKAIDQSFDFTDFMSRIDDTKYIGVLMPSKMDNVKGEVSRQGKPQNGLERTNSGDRLHQSKTGSHMSHCFHSLGDQLLYLWSTFLKFHRANKTKIIEHLREGWAKDRRAEWSIWMVYSKVEMPHHYINSGSEEPPNLAIRRSAVHKRVSSLWKLSDDPAQTAAMRAELHRRSILQMRINNRCIQDLHIFRDPSRIPIVIIERVMNAPRRSISENSYLRHFDMIDAIGKDSGPSSVAVDNLSGSMPERSGRILKIVVFVHGFQGHHLDLRLVRNQWLLIDPKIEFLMSEVNEEKTSGDFREMGLRLAQEVISFVKKKMDKASRYGSLQDIKISFVGHSIGNVIIRTALAESIMEPYHRHLYTYVSISGPHLGYLYSSNSLFNSGLWLLKKLKGTQCIHQLTFTDDPDLQNTFFYRLCKQKTLNSFKNIILFSSPQDGYVPYHSARIETCQAASMDNSRKGKLFLDMLNDCLDQIRALSSEQRVFMRCDVNFDTSAYGKNLNTIIGRAAHIEFLESDIFARFIMWSFPELFR
ncbi:protein FAM135B-like isoform X1 [Cucurbita pepo subsp. pepo]|uniref:protein FAM135B-like isoform X1 n=1 Tax=Cucurbita pepo subsp. pepo TaxID=3664 RepID=UPI000C9D9C1E|nr:protein FAM135B-like isoform X1 [Cucurbita pepo subsp. pepo]XP_023537066.1 protein FAM135B-like isoform X1 [Cucurbita pepo subsp. pepo]